MEVNEAMKRETVKEPMIETEMGTEAKNWESQAVEKTRGAWAVAEEKAMIVLEREAKVKTEAEWQERRECIDVEKAKVKTEADTKVQTEVERL